MGSWRGNGFGEGVEKGRGRGVKRMEIGVGEVKPGGQGAGGGSEGRLDCEW